MCWNFDQGGSPCLLCLRCGLQCNPHTKYPTHDTDTTIGTDLHTQYFQTHGRGDKMWNEGCLGNVLIFKFLVSSVLQY